MLLLYFSPTLLDSHNSPMRCAALRSAVIARNLSSTTTTTAAVVSRRWQSSTLTDNATTTTPTHEVVWGLWNEGNLFSLTVAQMDAFLHANRVTPDESKKKAMLVRQVEELLQKQENQSKGLPPPSIAPPSIPNRRVAGHGDWAPVVPVSQPETLLDLTQSGFYETPHAMAPKAFQLLVSEVTPDVVVSRVNTTSFPGFPANSECYTLASADAALSVRTRFSKAFQWCTMNMANLRLDAEFQADFGKLLVNENMIKKGRRIVSAYSFQQRIQVQPTPASQWVSAVSETSIPAMEALLADELFKPVGRKTVSYEVQIRRAKDVLAVELNHTAQQVTSIAHTWHHVQTSHLFTAAHTIDTRLLLRTRQPVRRQEVELYSKLPILTLNGDDIAATLPAEHGQVIYASENEVRRWEKTNSQSGARLTIVETRRQPLIVVRDEEEDPRVEYQLIVNIPCLPTEKIDTRLLSLELFDLAKLFAETLGEDFVKTYGCTPEPLPVTATHAAQATA